MEHMKPLVMSCGDPAGIGPEISVAAWEALGASIPFVWIGDPAHLPAQSRWEAIENLSEAGNVSEKALPVLPHSFATAAQPGKPDNAHAPAVIDVIARAVALVQSGAASGLVTCPINKAALKRGAGFGFPGHTEYLAQLAGGASVAMMLVCPELRVVPVTIHVPLAEVQNALSAPLLERSVRLTYEALRRDFAISQPRLAVAGLNPHAGENGTIGQEEITLILPVLEKLRSEGIMLEGPLSADTMFHAAARARYDAAICMYHDQALIPIKTIDFATGVNVTLGLPFIRTSPDHGTAYDIAGKGIADPSSLIAAVRLADQIARRRT